ncbi:hypothetical protein HanRHA438_Chr14g0669961 [Helianthus annuus]|nr:hypothetical protein HanRHA438_Chr14g0669961 [Helianthus annuus]
MGQFGSDCKLERVGTGYEYQRRVEVFCASRVFFTSMFIDFLINCHLFFIK